MKKLLNLRGLIIFILLIVTYAFWQKDTYIRYFEFRRLCDAGNGLEIYEKVEKNQVWQAGTLSEAQGYAQGLKSVMFVRAPDPQGRLVDVRYIGGTWGDRNSYSLTPSDLSEKPKYRIRTSFIGSISEDHRIWKTIVEVTNLSAHSVAYRWTQYTFKWRHQDRFLKSLFAPSGFIECPASTGEARTKEFNQKTFKD